MPNTEEQVSPQFADDLVGQIETKLKMLADYAYIQRAKVKRLEAGMQQLRVERDAMSLECMNLRQQLDLTLTDKGRVMDNNEQREESLAAYVGQAFLAVALGAVVGWLAVDFFSWLFT